MKRLLFLLSFSGALLCAADLAGIHSVYVMSMSHGLDQYLANRLTGEHVFRIVTDPKLADAVLTDHIGEAFEAQLEILIPKPEPVKPPPAESRDKSAAKDKPESAAGLMLDSSAKLPNMALTSTFGRNKGTLFLVEPKSHQVVWSAYQPPAGSTPKELDRTASDIVSRLKKDLNPPAAK